MTRVLPGVSRTVPVRRYHYVVAGAGSAGCVLASRLSENPANRVLLIEAGGRANNLLVRMPAAFSYAMNIGRLNWAYTSAPEPGLEGRRLSCPRGKGLGGSSSINGMVYVRGHGRDFDEWQRLGAVGWGFRDCLPYFQRAETWCGGADAFRGGDGPVATCTGNGMARNPLYAAFVEAGLQAGYGRTDDANGFRQEGFGAMQMTVRSGVRSSTAREYLEPAKRRGNLDVMLGTTVDKVLFDGKTATGVALRRGHRRFTVLAETEVLLAAGAVGSPCVLQRSGIGPRDVLHNAGVTLHHELPGVGENLQDHLEAIVQYACHQPVTLNGVLTPFGKAAIGLAWLLGVRKNRLGSTNHFEAGAFLRSEATRHWPDVQMHFLPAAMRYDGTKAFRGHGYQVHVGANKPKSRGRIAIRSADPDEEPSILFNYLAHEDDVPRVAKVHPLGARHHESAGVRRLPRHRESSQAPLLPRTPTSTVGCGGTSRAPTTRPARAGWGTLTIRWRYWTRSAGFAASNACAWWTHRSFLRFRTATSMRRPSWSPNARPT